MIADPSSRFALRRGKLLIWGLLAFFVAIWEISFVDIFQVIEQSNNATQISNQQSAIRNFLTIALFDFIVCWLFAMLAKGEIPQKSAENIPVYNPASMPGNKPSGDFFD